MYACNHVCRHVCMYSGANLVRSLGGGESGRRNFRLQPKKCPIFRMTTFLVVNSKKYIFSPKIFTFPLVTPIFLANFSLSYKKDEKDKKDEKRRFLTYFLCKIGYSVSRDPFTT